MKKFFLLLIVSLMCAVAAVAETPGNVAATSLNLPAVTDWLVSNWTSVALIVSEIAALISKKYSGIIKTVLVYIGTALQKKQSKS